VVRPYVFPVTEDESSDRYDPPSVSCAWCDTATTVDLPVSGEILDVTCQDPPERSYDAVEGRLRRIRTACPNGHTFVVTVRW